ncbi:hypothetical protein K501DRAFT_280099 [Backusella circina FSU 941]|nr:hypothetical protein K501DRAFT_280099 [Backusella circina FSU 941]
MVPKYDDVKALFILYEEVVRNSCPNKLLYGTNYERLNPELHFFIWYSESEDTVYINSSLTTWHPCLGLKAYFHLFYDTHRIPSRLKMTQIIEEALETLKKFKEYYEKNKIIAEENLGLRIKQLNTHLIEVAEVKFSPIIPELPFEADSLKLPLNGCNFTERKLESSTFIYCITKISNPGGLYCCGPGAHLLSCCNGIVGHDTESNSGVGILASSGNYTHATTAIVDTAMGKIAIRSLGILGSMHVRTTGLPCRLPIAM